MPLPTRQIDITGLPDTLDCIAMHDDDEIFWTIGELAKATGQTVRTLHHYDQIGLLPCSERTPGGYRVYSEDDFQRLITIVDLKELGLPLEQIRLVLEGDTEEVVDVVRKYLPEIDRQILQGERRRQRLVEFLNTMYEREQESQYVTMFPPRADFYGQTLKLGALYSLTGIAGVYGWPSFKAITLAVDTINQTGGINGSLISMEIEDDMSDPEQATFQTKRLILQRDVVCMMGPGISPLAASAHSVANQLKTPMVATNNFGQNIVGRNTPYPSEFIFRTNLGEDAMLRTLMTSFTKNFGRRRAVLIYSSDKVSFECGKYVSAHAELCGMDLVTSIEIANDDEDVSDCVTQALASNPEVLILVTVGYLPARIMQCARDSGYAGQFIGGNSLNTLAVSRAAGDAGKGALSINGWQIDDDHEMNRDFVIRYRERFGHDPDHLAAQAYSGVLVIAAAAKSAGLEYNNVEADRLKLRQALEAVDVDTPLGRIQFTSEHEIRTPVYLVEMNGNGHILVEKIAQPI